MGVKTVNEVLECAAMLREIVLNMWNKVPEKARVACMAADSHLDGLALELERIRDCLIREHAND